MFRAIDAAEMQIDLRELRLLHVVLGLHLKDWDCDAARGNLFGTGGVKHAMGRCGDGALKDEGTAERG